MESTAAQSAPRDAAGRFARIDRPSLDDITRLDATAFVAYAHGPAEAAVHAGSFVAAALKGGAPIEGEAETLDLIECGRVPSSDPLAERFAVPVTVQRAGGAHRVDEFLDLRGRLLPSGGVRWLWGCPSCDRSAAFLVRVQIRWPKRADLSPQSAWTCRACCGLRPARRRTSWKPGGESRTRKAGSVERAWRGKVLASYRRAVSEALA